MPATVWLPGLSQRRLKEQIFEDARNGLAVCAFLCGVTGSTPKRMDMFTFEGMPAMVSPLVALKESNFWCPKKEMKLLHFLGCPQRFGHF